MMMEIITRQLVITGLISSNSPIWGVAMTVRRPIEVEAERKQSTIMATITPTLLIVSVIGKIRVNMLAIQTETCLACRGILQH